MGRVCVVVPPRQELGHRVGGVDLAKLVFGTETLALHACAAITDFQSNG